MRIRNRPSYFRGLEEAPKKKSNVGRWVYLALLATLVALLVGWVGRSYLYLSAEGLVIGSTLDIQPLEDIRIARFLVHEGQSVEAGDPLFNYEQLKEETQYEVQEVRLPNPARITALEEAKGKKRALLSRIDNLRAQLVLLERFRAGALTPREALQVRDREEGFLDPKTGDILANIEKALSERQSLERQFAGEERVLGRMRELKLVEAYFVPDLEEQGRAVLQLQVGVEHKEWQVQLFEYALASRVQELRTELEDAETTVSERDVQIRAFSEHLHSVTYRTLPRRVTRTERGEHLAPVSGRVAEIVKGEQEIALKGQSVMLLQVQDTETIIRGFFDQEDGHRLGVGDRVDLIYPDGSAQDGRIRRLYVDALANPPELQSRYEPTQRSIVAEIVPVEKAVDDFPPYYRMSVEIRKPRYFDW